MQADLYDDLAERVVHGAQERFVAELTERRVEMFEAGVAEPDRYAVALAAAHAECMGVWARWEGRVSAEVEAAFAAALGQADEEIVESLAAAHSDGVSPLLRAQATATAVNAIGEAARATASIVRRQNVALSQTAPDAYYAALGEALTRLEMGEGREAVMARAMAAMADAGIETVDYRSGRRTTIDAAVRRHVVTQQSQCRADLLERRMDEWGHDLVYTSSHYGARPTHAVWQGRVFSRTGATPGYRTLAEGTGYGSPAGLCGCNCRHSFFPYTKQTKLPSRDFSAQEARTGLTSDEYYAATQRQRAIEREVRKVKREVGLGQRGGHDMAAQRMRLGVLQRRLREHCEANALRRDYSRERAYGVDEQPRALGTGQRGQSLTAFAASDAFKTAARAAGVTQGAALEALKAHVGGLGQPFESLTPARQLAALRRALRGLAKPKAARTLRAGATAEEARAFVRSDAQPKKVLAAKQNQHINGTKEWRERCERQGGAVLQSEITLSLEEIQALVDELHGTGVIRVTSANPPQVRETITVRGRIIGTWRGLSGDSSPTDCFTVHYSKKGTHIVPAPPSWRKQ